MTSCLRGRGTRHVALVGAVAACVLTGAVACSSSQPSGSTSSDDAQTSGSGHSQGIVAEAQRNVEVLYKGTEGMPPSGGPKAVPGKSVWVVSCGQAVVGCSASANAAVDAAHVLGWKVKLCDGNFDANNAYISCIGQAIAAKANGIILDSIDCVNVVQPLKQAKAAGVKVVEYNGFPCANDPSLATGVEPSKQATNLGAYARLAGEAQADYLITESKGHADIVNYRFVDNSLAIEINKGFEGEISKCGGCNVTDADISLSDYSNPSVFQQKVSAALVGAPQANAIHVPFDSFMTSGVGQAVVSSGRSASISAIALDGFSANLDLIRQKKGQTADLGADQVWVGYAAADTMNRIFAGSGPAPEGMGFRLIDGTHNLPASGDYSSPIDFKAAYKAVWLG